MNSTGMDAMESVASWDVPDNSVDASIAYLIAQLPEKEPSPYGDVVLQVGSGKSPVKSIKVSSQVLSIASPVFARMFGSGFLEGSVSSSRSDQPLHLPLPEDDPDAVLLMCHVLHPSGVGDLDVPLQLLESLALLVDKYDCALALTVWSRLWFQQRYNCFNYTSRPWDRLRIAYALGTEEAFWDISKNIIYNYGFEDDEESQESRLYQTGALELSGLKG